MYNVLFMNYTPKQYYKMFLNSLNVAFFKAQFATPSSIPVTENIACQMLSVLSIALLLIEALPNFLVLSLWVRAGRLLRHYDNDIVHELACINV